MQFGDFFITPVDLFFSVVILFMTIKGHSPGIRNRGDGACINRSLESSSVSFFQPRSEILLQKHRRFKLESGDCFSDYIYSQLHHYKDL